MRQPKTAHVRHGVRSTEEGTISNVIELEKSVWKAARARDVEAFSRLVPADGVMIFQSEVVRQPEYLATMKLRTVSHAKLKDAGIMPNATTVILIYKTVRVGSYDSERFPSTPVVESTTWIKRGRRWVAILNQETPITI
jgi:hypothetical protein